MNEETTKAKAEEPITEAHLQGHLNAVRDYRILGARWAGLPPIDGSRLALGTATISILGWERETPVIERWNDGLDLD